MLGCFVVKLDHAIFGDARDTRDARRSAPMQIGEWMSFWNNCEE
jgi:hypothetical protein